MKSKTPKLKACTFNLNDTACVKLTPRGKMLYEFSVHTPAGVKAPNILTIELWCLFQIFGEHLYLGGGAPLFANNEITLTEDP